MPILTLAQAEKPLAQGDVLKDVPLYVTDPHGQGNQFQARRVEGTLCLVLSRPCVALRSKAVVVANVEKYPDGIPGDLNTFGKVDKFLKKIRDGHGSPDIFYLGQLPADGLGELPAGLAKGRYAARLNSLHTIRVPDEPESRTNFLRTHRVYSLSPDFARDLHTRLFCAFASLGFHDQAWLPQDDLEWLVLTGDTELKSEQAKESELLADQAAKTADGKDYSDKELEAKRKKIEKLAETLEPFRRELENRKSPPTHDQSPEG